MRAKLISWLVAQFVPPFLRRRRVQVAPEHVNCRCDMPSREAMEHLANALSAELERMIIAGDNTSEAVRKVGEWLEDRPPYDTSLIAWRYGPSWNANENGTYTNPTLQ